MEVLPAFRGLSAQSRGVHGFTRDTFLKSVRVSLANQMTEELVETLSMCILPTISPSFPDAGCKKERKILPKLGPFGRSSAISFTNWKLCSRKGCVCVFNF